MAILGPNTIDTTILVDNTTGRVTVGNIRTLTDSLAGISSSLKTASYTAVLADRGTVVEMNSATSVVFTIPQNSSAPFDIGTVILVYAMGVGQVILAGAGNAGTPHRYWRLQLLSSAANPFDMAEVQFTTTPGTPRLFSGGTASASSVFSGAVFASAAADNDPSTTWAASSNASGEWWQYDYGAGNALGIAEVTITSRSDGSFFNETPTSFNVQSSDDSTTWATQWFVPATATWTAAQTQTFTNPSIVSAVTLRSSSSLALRTQFSTASVRKRATDEWVCTGDLA